MNSAKPVLVFRYTPTCAGIGDFLRAAGFMYDVCTRKGVEFYIDITNPIRHFFIYKKYDGDTSSFKHVDLRNPPPANVATFINTILGKESIVYTSNYTDCEHNPRLVNKIPDVLTPTSEILNNLNTYMEKIGIRKRNYSCIHIRYGDVVFKNRHTWDNRAGDDAELLARRIALAFELRKDKTIPTVILSDKYEAKVALSKQYACPLLDIHPVHTSFTEDIAAVHDTIIEFLVLTHASEVFSVTNSGFPRWAAAYGNIPNTEIWDIKM